MGGVTKAQLKEKLSKQLKTKEDCITIYGLSAKFGGGRSTGFALIYDNHDLLKKYDSKKQHRKVSHSSRIANFSAFGVLFSLANANL